MSSYKQEQTFIEKLRGKLPMKIKFALHICFKDGCGRKGVGCFLPDNLTDCTDQEEPDEYYCGKHAQNAGFCWSCGQFWGGVEYFDSGIGLCEFCRDELEDEFLQFDDEAVDDYDVGFNGEWFEDPADRPMS